ncbi:MAG TPA: hypothetical protein VK797_15280 [Tepidisphaeraceae bacterium]|nr:hypothetical protein [Tepidisphaeraceae bacterium]
MLFRRAVGLHDNRPLDDQAMVGVLRLLDEQDLPSHRLAGLGAESGLAEEVSLFDRRGGKRGEQGDGEERQQDPAHGTFC